MPSMQSLLGSNPMANALSRRGLSPNMLMQTTAGSPNFDPALQTPAQPPMPNKTPMTAGEPMDQTPMPTATIPNQLPPQEIANPQAAQQPMSAATMKKERSEAESIVKFLGDRLKALSPDKKMESMGVPRTEPATNEETNHIVGSLSARLHTLPRK